MSGTIEPALYYKYLTNQYYMYVMLEECLRVCGLPMEYWNVFRATRMRHDMQELEEANDLVFNPKLLTPTTTEYVTHVENLAKNEDIDGLIAHMYVRHFGDMYGGAMIASRVPGSGLMYEFEDKETLKSILRELLNDDMAPEANRCFEYAIRLFEELGNE